MVPLRFILVLIAVAVPALAQTPAAVEAELLRLHSIVEELPVEDWEKVEDANDNLQAYLVSQTKKAGTLAYPFPKFAKKIQIATSDDGRLRIYTWDDRLGGTMRSFRAVFQFRRPDGTVESATEERQDGDPGAFVNDIFTVRSGRSVLYLEYSTSIASTSNHMGFVRVLRIGRRNLDFSVKAIRTKTGLTASLAFEYDFFSVVGRKERPVRLASYDKRSRTLRIPVVVESDRFQYGEVTGRFISYRFNGRYFVRMK